MYKALEEKLLRNLQEEKVQHSIHEAKCWRTVAIMGWSAFILVIVIYEYLQTLCKQW